MDRGDQMVGKGDGEVWSRLRQQHESGLAFDVRIYTNRSVILGVGDPASVGGRLTGLGIRYGAVLGHAAARPFFAGAVLACGRAITTPHKKRATVYDELYARFLTHYGIFVATALEHEREDPTDTAHLSMALANLTMAFTSWVAAGARREPASFRTSEFSAYSITVLSLARVARLWDIAIDEEAVSRICGIQLHKRHDRLRIALRALLVGDTSSDDEFANVFRGAFNVRSYDGVLISNIPFTHAYACSLARFGGRMATALTRLMRD